MADLLDLMGSGKALLSIIAPKVSSDELTGEGYYARSRLRKGRVFVDADGNRYRLTTGLERGIWCMGARQEAYRLNEPVRLQRVKCLG